MDTNLTVSHSELMLQAPEVAVLAETNETVPIEEVAIGSTILICAGERIPLDGEVIKGKRVLLSRPVKSIVLLRS